MSEKGKKRKRKVSKTKRQAEFNRAMRQIEPVAVPLCELFAVVDDVFTEDGAFSQEHIKKSLGRIHREWKKTRAALDPEFDPKDYEKRPRKAGTNPRSPLVTGSRRSSTDRKSISERSGSQSGRRGKSGASSSAKRARSSGRASNGR